jgi:tRNA A37 threonylcarbamoyladenosine biosynthesis protein TsaE
LMHYDLYQHNIDHGYLIDRLANGKTLILIEWSEKLSTQDLDCFQPDSKFIKIDIRVNPNDSRTFVFC